MRTLCDGREAPVPSSPLRQKGRQCGDTITLADYVGASMATVGELVHCRYEDYPNIRRWIGNMKALKSWAQVHEVAYGYAAALKDKQFVSI